MYILRGETSHIFNVHLENRGRTIQFWADFLGGYHQLVFLVVFGIRWCHWPQISWWSLCKDWAHQWMCNNYRSFCWFQLISAKLYNVRLHFGGAVRKADGRVHDLWVAQLGPNSQDRAFVSWKFQGHRPIPSHPQEIYLALWSGIIRGQWFWLNLVNVPLLPGGLT